MMRRMNPFGLAAGLLVALAASVLADPGASAPGPAAPQPVNPGDEILAPPPTYQANGVGVTEQLGARLPLDARFRTVDGTEVTLGQVLHPSAATAKKDGTTGDLPVLLSFNYSSCPMLCSLQLNGLVKSLSALDLRVGGQFRIVTIDLDPRDSLERATRMRDRYINQLPADRRPAARAGWTFLLAATPGDATQIQRVANLVGFAYKYLPDQAEYAHPAALIALSSQAVVTRYVYGIEFAAAMLTETILKAGLAEPMTAIGFMNRCYHFDPDANNHARAGMLALQLGAAGFLVLFVASFGILYLRRASTRRSVHAL